jgi:ComF family protein
MGSGGAPAPLVVYGGGYVSLQYQNGSAGCQPRNGPWLQRLWQAALPMRCVLCDGAAQQANICEPCFRGLPGNHEACPLCALPLAGHAGITCASCVARPPAWHSAHAALAYQYPVDTLVQLLKFKRQVAAGPALARAMACAAPPLYELPASWLVPVPLHLGRTFFRGFNQAAELALHLHHSTGLPLATRWLRRCRRTAAQSGLNARQRRNNLRGAFRWYGPRLDGAHLILVDDVMTTGSTLTECTRVLKKAGAGRISAWVAARA